MADPSAAPVLTADADKSPLRIEQEMEQTRESISTKVAALETQVLGTIQSATDTIADTVQSVKDAPAAVKESVQETVDAVKESVRETISSVRESVASLSLSRYVRNNPGTAVGTSAIGGFLAGYFLLGRRDRAAARGSREALPDGRQGSVPPAFPASSGHAEPARSGMFDGLMGMVRSEVEQLARQALATAVASLKQSMNEKIPLVMDEAVQSFTSRVTGHNGAAHAGYSGPPPRGQADPVP